MQIVTSQGHKLETLESHGRSTPFRNGEFYVVRVAVNGQACPPCQIPAPTWQEESATLSEPDFWQNVADAALTMRDAEAALHN